LNANSLVNAWILLDEDAPPGTNYNSPNSSFQRLIKNNVYQSVDILNIAFFTTLPTGAKTVPPGDGTSYTITTVERQPGQERPGGITNFDYMLWVMRDARKNNPGIKITATLDYGNSLAIANIFSNPKVPPPQNAINFAANLMTFLDTYKLDGFDIDWEWDLSRDTTKPQFGMMVGAVGDRFKKRTDKHFYFTLSPAEVGTLDPAAVNNYMDFINLQLYASRSLPQQFADAGVNPKLFAYGAKFEAGYQDAENAYNDNLNNFHFNNFTCWRLNSGDFDFEQDQQQKLYQLVVPTEVRKAI
jgi:hypothetical protein